MGRGDRRKQGAQASPLPLSRGPRLTVPSKANILKQSEVWGFNFYPALSNNWASLVAHTVKSLPTVQKTRVQSLGQEDPPEKGMAAHSSILAWKIPWTEELGGLQSMDSQSDMTE